MDKNKLKWAKRIVKDIRIGGGVTELQILAIAVIIDALENMERDSNVDEQIQS